MHHHHPYNQPIPYPLAVPIRVDAYDKRSCTVYGMWAATTQHLRGRRWLHTLSLTNANYSPLTTHWTYTFSAKEKDPETGLTYFGSRYYSSDLSIWLSVDPMASKYPGLSPYVYCADNPVKLVDPNGEENLPALLWARNNLSNKGIGFATHFNKEKGWIIKEALYHVRWCVMRHVS